MSAPQHSDAFVKIQTILRFRGPYGGAIGRRKNSEEIDHMTKHARIAALAVATMMAGSLTLSAQSPESAGKQRQATTADTLKLTGCLKMEKEVPGLKPNIAERVGVTEDYILTSAVLSKDSTVSGIGVSSMYEIEGLAEDELKKHVNHQVEIEGRIGAVGSDGDAPDFSASSLKMLSATCPAR